VKAGTLPGAAIWAAAAVLLGLLALLAVTPAPAEAHAILIRSDPPVNARLQDPPPVVSAFFSETLDTRLSSLKVVNGEGKRVDSGETSFGPDAAQMSTTIPEPLPPGFYAVLWQTLSSVDGHLLKGSYPFTVLNPDGSEPAGPRPSAGGGAGYSGGAPTADAVAVKWAGLLAAALTVGALAFLTLVAGPLKAEAGAVVRRHCLRSAWVGTAGLAVTGAAELIIQARRLGGLGFLDEALDTVWGERWIERQALLLAIAGLLWAHGWAKSRRGAEASTVLPGIALIGGFQYLLLVAMTSHASSVPGSFWAVGADFVHLAAAALWVGMLFQLALFLTWVVRRTPPDQRPALLAQPLRRFSALAATSVALLLATGLASSLTEVPDFEALADTAYGRSLAVKLGAVALLMAVGGLNAVLLAPRARRQSDESSDRRFVMAVRTEIVLAVAVLAVAAVFVQYPTARQQRDAAANVQASTQAVVGYDQIQDTGSAMVNLTISPKAVGTNSFRVFLFPPSGGQLGEVQRVRLRFKPPDPTLGPSEVIAEPAGLNAYKAVGPFFTTPGAWEVAVDLRRREVEDVTAVFRVAVPGAQAEGGGQFSLPLLAGSWTTVAAIGVLLVAVLMIIWAAQWPALPRRLGRALRIGSGFISVIGLAILVESLFPAGQSGVNPVQATGSSIAVGRSLYVNNCARCHGAEGRGDGPDAKSLGVPPADFRQHIPYHTDLFFFQVISNGLGNFMPPFADQITEEERWHLINFLKAEYGVDTSLPPP